MANAHFLRGILSESWHCGFDVLALEPADNWSAANLVQDHGPAALAARPIAMRSISQPDLFTYITVLTSSAGAGAVPWRMPTWSSPAPYVPEGIGVSPLVQSIGSRVSHFTTSILRSLWRALPTVIGLILTPSWWPASISIFPLPAAVPCRCSNVGTVCARRGCSIARSIPTPTRRFPAEPVWDMGYLGTCSADRRPALEELMCGPARRCRKEVFVVAGPSIRPKSRGPPMSNA
jgi:hypothetical protein